MIIEESAYLEHFGVKGMKWGVIRQRYRKAHARSTQKRASVYKNIASRDPSIHNKSMARTAQQKADRAKRWEAGKPTRLDKAHRAVSAAWVVAIGGVVTAAIISEHGRTPTRDLPRPSRVTKSSVEQMIRNEHATQLSSLTRMHKEGKMDADQFKKFSESLAKRYDRKIAEALGKH